MPESESSVEQYSGQNLSCLFGDDAIVTTIVEIDTLFGGTVVILPDEAHSVTERRFKAVGKTEEGRQVFIVFTLRADEDAFYIRPISARYMHRREIESYEEENPDL